MATLSNEQKMFLIQRLACFESIDEVKKAYLAEYGVELKSQQIDMYDTTKAASVKLSQKWRDLFVEIRTRFQEQVADIPIANKAFRLKVMQKTMEEARKMRNYPLVMQTLEQAAKECGDAYTNRHKLEHTGKDGGPMEAEVRVLSAEEYKKARQEMLDQDDC